MVEWMSGMNVSLFLVQAIISSSKESMPRTPLPLPVLFLFYQPFLIPSQSWVGTFKSSVIQWLLLLGLENRSVQSKKLDRHL